MDKKNIYDDIHEMNGSLEGFERVELNEFEKARFEKLLKSETKRFKFNFKKATIIAASLVLMLTLFGQTEIGVSVYATVISALKDIKFSMLSMDSSESNNDRYVENDEEFNRMKPYLCDVNSIAKDKGVEIKLSDVLISEDRFMFSFILHKDNAESKSYSISDYDIFINGELAKMEDESSSGYFTNDGTFFETAVSRIEGIKTREDLDIKIKINTIMLNHEPEYLDGNWEFNFTANGKKLANDSIVKEINQTFEQDGFKVEFVKLVYSPLDKVIYAKISENYCGIDDEFKLLGEDDLGNKFQIGVHQYSSSNELAYFENAGGSDIIKIGEGAKSLKLCLYYRRLPDHFEGGGPEFKKFGEEFIIDLQ